MPSKSARPPLPMAPSFFRPERVDELIDYCAAIASQAARLPFYYYDIPHMTGVHIPVGEFLERGLEKIPTLAGVKFTNNDLEELQRCLAARDGRYNVLFGFDEMLLSPLKLGVHGAVGGSYTVAPQLYRNILTTFQAGDLEGAERDQAQATAMVAILARLGVVRAGKAAMKLLGIDCGAVRLPLRNLAPEELDGLRRGLDELGLLPTLAAK